MTHLFFYEGRGLKDGMLIKKNNHLKRTRRENRYSYVLGEVLNRFYVAPDWGKY